jgi:hypothetical protein
MKTYLIGLVALALAACTTPASQPPLHIPAPAEYAERDAADEQAAVAVENGYKAFRLALELGVDTGVLKGERAVKAAAADRQAYNALLIFREAYKTANAADLLTAGRSANIAIAQAIAIVKGN